MSDLGPWRLEQDGPLAVLTIDKPPLNLFAEDVFDGVLAALEQRAAPSRRAACSSAPRARCGPAGST